LQEITLKDGRIKETRPKMLNVKQT